jgi:hypothetical protein
MAFRSEADSRGVQPALLSDRAEISDTSLTETNDVFKRFNRDTKRLTVALLSILTSCALALGMEILERHGRWIDLTADASTVGSEVLLVHSNEKDFTEEFIPRQEAPGMTAPKEGEAGPEAESALSDVKQPSSNAEPMANDDKGVNSSPHQYSILIEPAKPSPQPLAPKATVSKWVSTHRREPEPLLKRKNSRESYGTLSPLTDFAVKMRLIELWHQSLRINERPRRWTMSSHWHKGGIVGYTAQKEPRGPH